jgi:hypothetical protein
MDKLTKTSEYENYLKELIRFFKMFLARTTNHLGFVDKRLLRNFVFKTDSEFLKTTEKHLQKTYSLLQNEKAKVVSVNSIGSSLVIKIYVNLDWMRNSSVLMHIKKRYKSDFDSFLRYLLEKRDKDNNINKTSNYLHLLNNSYLDYQYLNKSKATEFYLVFTLALSDVVTASICKEFLSDEYLDLNNFITKSRLFKTVNYVKKERVKRSSHKLHKVLV